MNQKKVKIGLRRVTSSALTQSRKDKLTELLYQASLSDSDQFTKLVERHARKQAAKISREEAYKALPPLEYGPWKWERTPSKKESNKNEPKQ